MPLVRPRLPIRVLLISCLAFGAVLFLQMAAFAPAEDAAGKAADADAGLGDARKIGGSPSCSAASCHGSVEPRPGPGDISDRNEFTLWARSDPHAHAHAVLFDELSIKMGKLLDLTPHEDVRCLACHTNPAAAVLPADPKRKGLIEDERRWGVGCESCHGPGQDWLVEHTRSDWTKLSPTQKKSKGMIPLDDLAEQFRNCAGCHVGAPAEHGLPVRDVTHDFIAAGHPRLHFEPSTYLANLPPHWKVERKQRQDRAEGQTWVLGQLAAAAASLDLTLDRGKRDHSWPELAEFSCYACHHDLAAPSWRQARDLDAAQVTSKRGRAGRIPWSDWYWTGPGLLAETDFFTAPQFKTSFDQLGARLSLPPTGPDRDWKRHAGTLKEQVERMLEQAKEPWDRARSRSLLARIGKKDLQRITSDWEQAEQLFLGCLALNQDAGLKELDSLLWNELLNRRAFPPRIASPRDFRPDEFFPILEKALRAEE